jgi:hypothetical protein
MAEHASTEQATTTQSNQHKKSAHHHHHFKTEGVTDMLRMREGLKMHHKLLYVAIAFVGLNFCWFGVWNAIAATPFIRNPLVAVIIGVILMRMLGKINDLA